MPSAFGVHLEWRLRLPPRPPLPQRGACPACRARLQASLMSQPRYCHYLGSYFCGGCHRGELRVIPARVVERWDFGPRKVCHEAAKYLDMQNDQPLIPITEIRRTKLTTQAALTEVHGLRQKLSRIREIAADSDCDFIKVLLDMLLKQLPSHMMQGHDLYTLEDLIQLENKGKYCDFFQKLKDLVKKAAEHIIECPTCKVDAQTCLLCLSARPVYAFQVDECITCRRCKVLYHAVCFRRAGMECPQCMQLRAHERKPSLSDVRAR
ncbi:unnamed protein product [Prorocentrum cordatum]|uniref:Phorbol-ester/DAG-type domain-containing protein n=1 Tax=Prorocentrum cordatum TaxID=2364126 RepID=A0ABN9UVE9_9DINO|nr:unnamed protein product [Polarella glacialis]